MFISVEGVEGVGKTTNIQFIKAWLEKNAVNVELTREPGGTPLAEELRALLLKPRDELVDETAELLMIFAARAQHYHKKIVPALAQNQWVLCDRFTDATYAYQGYGRGLSLDTINTLESMVLSGVGPQKTFYLDLPVAIGLERARKRGPADRFEQEQEAFFESVRRGYLARVAADPERFIVIDASVSLAQVQQQIERALEALVLA